VTGAGAKREIAYTFLQNRLDAQTCPKARPAYPPGHLPVPASGEAGRSIMEPSMAQRPIWRGHLRLALVSCPVALFSAQHDRNTVRFNMINPETGNRIRMVTVDAETGEPVERGETVKGYQFKKDHYLIVTEDDLASVKIESSSVMTIDKFVTANAIDPVYFDSSYYVAPDGGR
jgi:non-homologous end joining protein Ku